MQHSEINESLLQKHLQKLIEQIGSIGNLHDEVIDKFTRRQMTLLIINLRKEVMLSILRQKESEQQHEQNDSTVSNYELGEKYKEG
jgi:hypothetical protein